MFKELGQLSALIKQAPLIAGRMQELRARLASRTFEGSAADGLVKIYLAGDGRVTGCHLDPSLLDPARPSRLQDAIITATNAAMVSMQQATAGEMQEATGGLDLSALGGLMGLGPKG